MMITPEELMRQLIGCSWGHGIATPDDATPCTEKAVQIVVLHIGEEEREFRFCAKHLERINSETTPHEEPKEDNDTAEIHSD
jgi:hypothetical protein